MAKTNTERQRELRERRRAEGLVKIEAWVSGAQADRLRKYIQKLERERGA